MIHCCMKIGRETGKIHFYDRIKLKNYIAHLEPKELKKKDMEVWDKHLNSLVDAYEQYAYHFRYMKSYDFFKRSLLDHATKENDSRAFLPK